jgi:hypothetical protein
VEEYRELFRMNEVSFELIPWNWINAACTPVRKMFSFPVPSNVNPPLQVTLTAKDPSMTVKVKLWGKGTVITGMVRDAINGEPLAASFTLRPLRFPDRPMLMGSPAAFRIFIAPATDYSLEVSAPGYKNWSFSKQHNPSKPLRLARGAHLNLDVQLEPIASTGFVQSTPRAGVSDTRLPDLGAQVSTLITKARIGTQECLTDLAHYDPCARITIGGILFTIAWDQQTELITALHKNS